LGTRCFFDFPAMPILLDRGRVATDDQAFLRNYFDSCASSLRSTPSPLPLARWSDPGYRPSIGRNEEDHRRRRGHERRAPRAEARLGSLVPRIVLPRAAGHCSKKREGGNTVATQSP
jgi:hypothetical protein